MCPSLTEHQSETQCHKLDPTMIACDSLPFFGNLFDVVFLVFSMIEDGQYPWTPHFCHPDDCFDCCSFSSKRRQLHRIITRITIIFVWCSSHTEMENISFFDVIGKPSLLWRLNINFRWILLDFLGNINTLERKHDVPSDDVSGRHDSWEWWCPQERWSM